MSAGVREVVQAGDDHPPEPIEPAQGPPAQAGDPEEEAEESPEEVSHGPAPGPGHHVGVGLVAPRSAAVHVRLPLWNTVV
ncbi:MAG: hypothetical protein A3J66_00100 [Candidatus Magasanikbacteria bacterium RIFCSPHIGHO2_02_FULL_47_14]|uniref:Uncharacterized protein n=1 Tax=Candidatus Magasanikbacteria bacterium RIFCSPHIGHO2_02_FULL_47_14 TaxID=1798680 RepID=A0A1F6LYV8_9BACT|nr:MAG: hypothetical protein A3J66_00100 [Candidatus Magasanikbacteria bacterium RIFCSPHIGHO2_02_FULL_47_14]